MNTPESPSPRRQGTLRREVLPVALFVVLLASTSVACAQNSLIDGSANSNRRAPAEGSAWVTDRQADLSEFGAWACKFAKAQGVGSKAAAPDAVTLTEGVRLAERRRIVLGALMYSDPTRALSVSVPAAIRAKLPADVLSRLETPFSAVGDYSVDNRSGHREVTVNGGTYGAHVSGQQLTTSSQRGVLLHGFTLDGEAVLDANPPRVKTQVRQVPLPNTTYGNDPFSGALQLFGNSGTIADDNVGATKEPGEPDHAGDPGGASVWYTWTPSGSGQATFTTDDGVNNVTVDTLLAVYTGSDVASLTYVAADDDYGVGFNSQVSFYARAGQTYYIAVDGFLYFEGPSEGSFSLTYFQQSDPLSPTITSDTFDELQTNTFYTYTITSTGGSVSYSATGLPFGLTLDPQTGVISGMVTDVGTYTAFLSAMNLHGTSTISLTLSVIDTPIHKAFFRTEVALPQNPGVYYLHLPRGNIFGYYAYLDDDNYIYHYDLGYEYTFNANDGKAGIYFYDFASDTFFYTSPTFPFPFLYDFSLKTVLYYYPDLTRDGRYNTNGVRYFYNYSTRQIITK